MSGGLTLATLSLPAMLGAGLSSSPHCAVMCGIFHARLSGTAAVARHLGRLGAYALVGAVAGGAGQWLLRAAAWLPLGEGARVALLPVALLVLLVRAKRRGAAGCCTPVRGREQDSSLRHAVRGFATVLVPCAPLYAAAAYAGFSASAASGALLLFAFGAGTIPPVQAGAWAWARAGRGVASIHAMREMPLMFGLLASAAIGVAWLATGHPAPWCVQ